MGKFPAASEGIGSALKQSGQTSALVPAPENGFRLAGKMLLVDSIRNVPFKGSETRSILLTMFADSLAKSKDACHHVVEHKTRRQ